MLPDAVRGLPVPLHPRGENPGSVAAPGVKDVIAASTSLPIGRIRHGRQAWVVNRVALALVADAPLTCPAIKRGRIATSSTGCMAHVGASLRMIERKSRTC